MRAAQHGVAKEVQDGRRMRSDCGPAASPLHRQSIPQAAIKLLGDFPGSRVADRPSRGDDRGRSPPPEGLARPLAHSVSMLLLARQALMKTRAPVTAPSVRGAAAQRRWSAGGPAPAPACCQTSVPGWRRRGRQSAERRRAYCRAGNAADFRRRSSRMIGGGVSSASASRSAAICRSRVRRRDQRAEPCPMTSRGVPRRGIARDRKVRAQERTLAVERGCSSSQGRFRLPHSMCSAVAGSQRGLEEHRRSHWAGRAAKRLPRLRSWVSADTPSP